MTAAIESYRTNLRDELNGAAVYAALAAAETLRIVGRAPLAKPSQASPKESSNTVDAGDITYGAASALNASYGQELESVVTRALAR